MQTAQDLPAVLLELLIEIDGSIAAFSTLFYLSDDGTSVTIQYVFPADEFEASKELAHYSFDTFLGQLTARLSQGRQHSVAMLLNHVGMCGIYALR